MEQKTDIQKVQELTARLNRYRDEYYNKNARPLRTRCTAGSLTS